MNHLFRTSVKSRVISSRLSSLLLLFQRSPIVQMLFPEARVLGGAGLGELAKWTVASVAGLGAYDTVAGATSISQLIPNSGSSSVTAAVGSSLNFTFQCTGSPEVPAAWTVSVIPPGLTHSDSTLSSTDTLSGIPTTEGIYSVVTKAWRYGTKTGDSFSKTFTLTVGSSIITTQPSTAVITSGSSTTLSVAASGSPLTYQWYSGTSGTGSAIVGATASSYTTPALTGDANYWVKVTRGTLTATTNPVIANSATAAVTIRVAPTITTQPAASTTITSGSSTTLNVAASGSPPPTYQWYVGSPPDISTPAPGATATTASYTTPTLSTSTNYWAKASSSAGSANSNVAAVTVNQPAAITTHPASITIASGNTTTLSVIATGTGPLTYQWYQGSSGVTTTPVGTNSPSYTTVPLSGNASYWVKVSNAANFTGVNSNVATVTVNAETFANWQSVQFTPTQLSNPLISGPTADPDGDGITNEKEYLFGLLPLTNDPSPSPTMLKSPGQLTLGFIAKAATGSGYAGKTRHYAIEGSDSLTSGSWTAIPGYQDIIATGQTVSCVTATTGPHKFYHLRVWLTP